LRPLRFFFALVLFLPMIAVACTGGDSGPPTSDVVARIPWSGSEEHSYVLVDGRGDELARGTLTVRPGNSGSTELMQSFKTATNEDTIVVVVDARTLKPISSSRDIVTATKEESLEVEYTEEGALIRQGGRQSGLSVPEHSYDNDSSLFLWRTLPFEEGYEASYVTIITNQRNRQTVNVRVVGKETVNVPAGRFDAWRLEITTSEVRQVAWFADTPSRPLVRYNNSQLVFELTSLGTSAGSVSDAKPR
jgi:hypothetical protein